MARTWTMWNRLALLAALLSTGAGSAFASQAIPDKPQAPAKMRFAADFPALTDHQWGFRIGGIGGIARGAPLRHVPLILVHGNDVDHADWYPVRDDFKAAGWTDQELWALSYNGAGGSNGSALTRQNPERDAEHQEICGPSSCPAVVTGDDVNVPDLYDFILAVRDYTGSKNFSIAAHSLGVTLARKVLKVHPELRQDLVAFVAIAGANHGTSFCPEGSQGQLNSCDEIAAGTPWLAELNGPNGDDESYGPGQWLTVYDGTGAGDPAFAGPTYAQSPNLKGADNRQFPGTYHNDLRIDAPIVAEYRAFIEAAETKAGPRNADSRGTLLMGSGAMSPWLLLAFAALAPVRGLRRRLRRQ
jgi:pimeloyl-ACP methyl ester carboxylesterase